MDEPDNSVSREEEVGATMHRRTREGRHVVLYEYRDTGAKVTGSRQPVHRSYLNKSSAE